MATKKLNPVTHPPDPAPIISNNGSDVLANLPVDMQNQLLESLAMKQPQQENKPVNPPRHINLLMKTPTGSHGSQAYTFD